VAITDAIAVVARFTEGWILTRVLRSVDKGQQVLATQTKAYGLVWKFLASNNVEKSTCFPVRFLDDFDIACFEALVLLQNRRQVY
jgi:hypothetical protein